MYSSKTAFNEAFSNLCDDYSFGMVIQFLILDVSSFIQLNFYPIETDPTLKKIRDSLQTLKIFEYVDNLICEKDSVLDLIDDLEALEAEEYCVHAQKLIAAGIPKEWFVEFKAQCNINTLDEENKAQREAMENEFFAFDYEKAKAITMAYTYENSKLPNVCYDQGLVFTCIVCC